VNNDLINDFLRQLQYNKGRSKLTIKKYKSFLDRLLAWSKKEDLKFLELDIKNLEKFTGTFAHEQGLTPRSRRPLVAAIRGFYKYLLKNKKIQSNPATTLPYPQIGRRLPVAMSIKNAERLVMQPSLETFAGLRDTAIITLFIGTGIRLGGLTGLNESNLVFTSIEGQEWLILKVLEKGEKERLIPVPHEARHLIRAYLAHPDITKIDRTLPTGDKVLFISLGNKNVKPHEYHGERRRMSDSGIQKMIVKHAAAAGLPRNQQHPHSLRHLFGTELAENDVQESVRQALMGHANPASTQIYTHLAARKLAQSVDKANPLNQINTPMTAITKELLRHGK